MVEEVLREAIVKFNKKAETDPKLAKEISGMTRVVQFEISDTGEFFHFTLENQRVGELQNGRIENADIRVICDAEVLKQLYSGELRPMKAIATRKIHVKAKLEDMLTLRKFF
jgi:putative sterol carrier protein